MQRVRHRFLPLFLQQSYSHTRLLDRQLCRTDGILQGFLGPILLRRQTCTFALWLHLFPVWAARLCTMKFPIQRVLRIIYKDGHIIFVFSSMEIKNLQTCNSRITVFSSCGTHLSVENTVVWFITLDRRNVPSDVFLYRSWFGNRTRAIFFHWSYLKKKKSKLYVSI